jgi:hypothetical protein
MAWLMANRGMLLFMIIFLSITIGVIVFGILNTPFTPKKKVGLLKLQPKFCSYGISSW